MDAFLSPGYQPFTIAGLVMVGLVVIETVSLVAGLSLSHALDHSFPIDAYDGHHADLNETGFLGGVFGWVNAGRVPVLMSSSCLAQCPCAGAPGVSTWPGKRVDRPTIAMSVVILVPPPAGPGCVR